jgi:hypothetical protein
MWKLNKSLSDDIISRPGAPRREPASEKGDLVALCAARDLTASFNEIRIEQTATAAGIPGMAEQYILDHEWMENRDPFFGLTRGRSRWTNRSKVEEEGLRDVLDELDEGGLIEVTGGDVDGNWRAMHVWGFLEIQGHRKPVRKVVVKGKDGEEVRLGWIAILSPELIDYSLLASALQ